MKTITRKDLYDKIWSITKAKTAKELNISPIDLSRICKEHNIPSPTSNYWMHVGWGEDVEKTPLPNPESNPVIDLTKKTPRKKDTKINVSTQASIGNNYSEILDNELSRITEEKEIRKLKEQALAGKFIIDFQKPAECLSEDRSGEIRCIPGNEWKIKLRAGTVR